MSKYLLKAHDYYFHRIRELTARIQELHKTLDPDQFVQHPTVKLARRIREADRNIIPQDPNRPEYCLTGELKKYRRYKQGLQRYRLFFCFSSHPGIILYLYLNDEKHLRKEGDKNDPYEIFKKFVKQEIFSNDPENQKIQKWIREYKYECAKQS